MEKLLGLHVYRHKVKGSLYLFCSQYTPMIYIVRKAIISNRDYDRLPPPTNNVHTHT